jgi:hypothetical protein
MENFPHFDKIYGYLKNSTDDSQSCNKCGKQYDTMSKCSKCKCVFYCSSECQKSDWMDHKIICKEIEQALKLAGNGHCSYCRKPGAKMYKCSICLITRYCSKEHQKADWREHKKTCTKTDKEDPRVKLSKINIFTIFGMVGESLKFHGRDKECDTFIMCKVNILLDTFFDYIQGKTDTYDQNSVVMTFHKKDELLKTFSILGKGYVYQDNYYYVICCYKDSYIFGQLTIYDFKKLMYYDENK